MDAISYTDSFGGFWVTPLKIFGGNYAAGVAIPFVWNSVTAKVTVSNVGTASRTDTANGLGDIEFFPVAIGWSAMGGDLHINVFGGIYAPTGEYDNNRLANQGVGYWTFEPGVLLSYLGQKKSAAPPRSSLKRHRGVVRHCNSRSRIAKGIAFLFVLKRTLLRRMLAYLRRRSQRE